MKSLNKTSRCLIVILGFFAAINAGRSDVIRLVGDSWCPFSCAAGSERQGLFVELSRLLLESKGHTVQYEEASWARAVQDTRANTYTAIAGALKADAPDFVFPKSSFASQRSCLFVKKGSKFKYSGLESLNAKLLGAVKDYTYGDPIDQYLSKNSNDPKKVDLVTGTNTALKLFKKLIDSRIEVAAEDQSVQAFVVSSNPELASEQIVNAGCQAAVPLFVAFGPANPKSKLYAQQLSQAFEAQKNSQSVREIYKKYGVNLR
jgi:polar amino acid transport system substrate-binding protein